MTLRLSLLVLLCLGSVGCVSFESAVREFDILAGIDGDEEWPTRLDYEDNAKNWAIALQEVDEEIDDWALENPSGFARDRFVALVRKSRGDLDMMARAAARTLLVLQLDDNRLTRLEAIDGMGEILSDLQADPLEHMWMQTEPRVLTERHETAMKDLLARVPSARAPDWSAGEREKYLEVLAALTDEPTPTINSDSVLIRALRRAAAEEPDRALRRSTNVALVRAIANAFARALHASLLAPDPAMRESALLVVYRLSGMTSLPVLLERLSAPSQGRWRYPRTIRERRTLLRLSAQLSGDPLFLSFRGGPRPIDFLYDTLSRDDDEGLRLVALETMARCLRRPIDFDPAWAHKWWREFALREKS